MEKIYPKYLCFVFLIGACYQQKWSNQSVIWADQQFTLPSCIFPMASDIQKKTDSFN